MAKTIICLLDLCTENKDLINKVNIQSVRCKDGEVSILCNCDNFVPNSRYQIVKIECNYEFNLLDIHYDTDVWINHPLIGLSGDLYNISCVQNFFKGDKLKCIKRQLYFNILKKNIKYE